MKIGRWAGPLGGACLAAFMVAGPAGPASAGTPGHDRGRASQPEGQSPAEGALVKVVREATQRFADVSVATSEGYALQFGCVSGGDFGAMELHFINGALVGDGEIDATRPEIVLYEPLPNGRVRITGADYLVLAADWDARHAGPPELMGQLFHLFESPNRFGLPPFYTLHVWAWKENPNGTFVNWNPNVSCEAFNPEPGMR
jgi:hypothetical protein